MRRSVEWVGEKESIWGGVGEFSWAKKFWFNGNTESVAYLERGHGSCRRMPPSHYDLCCAIVRGLASWWLKNILWCPLSLHDIVTIGWSASSVLANLLSDTDWVISTGVIRNILRDCDDNSNDNNEYSNEDDNDDDTLIIDIYWKLFNFSKELEGLYTNFYMHATNTIDLLEITSVKHTTGVIAVADTNIQFASIGLPQKTRW